MDQESNTPSQSERLQQLIASEYATDIFIFDQYCIGIKSKVEKGFRPHGGPPGKSKFCERGKELAKLAQEFMDTKEEP
eukprot:689342-Ditylum_brightwellii.AAC.1